jgi:hypothetical protein
MVAQISLRLNLQRTMSLSIVVDQGIPAASTRHTGDGVALTLNEAHLQPYCAGSNRGLAPSHYVPRRGAVRRF